MEQLRLGFEKALKAKLSQKCTATQSEETVFARCFKYFDTDNDGHVSLDEWYKAIEKVGVIVPSLDDLRTLFNYYDKDGNGELDYKELADIVIDKSKSYFLAHIFLEERHPRVETRSLKCPKRRKDPRKARIETRLRATKWSEKSETNLLVVAPEALSA